jgi:hypothetical protein
LNRVAPASAEAWWNNLKAFKATITLRLWLRPFGTERQPQRSRTALNGLLAASLERKKAEPVKKPKQITYWAFCVDIVGPRCNSKSEDRRVHKLLGKSVLREMEELARRAVQEKLPRGFEATIS